jgi:hypothetical protein
MLDALVDVGYDPAGLEALSDADRRRADRLHALFGLLNDYPTDDADESLLDATLARINRYEDQRKSRMRVDMEPRRFRGLPFRLPDFITVAAVMLIGVAFLWPTLTTIRNSSLDQRCQNNMRLMSHAFSHYAADSNGEMPMALASFGGGAGGASWDRVPNVVVNLAPLVDGQYCSRGHLNCPGNHDQHTYSYQWQKPGTRLMWGGVAAQVTIVLGDRNPIIDAARAGHIAPALVMSPDHAGRGQNVLSTDGSTLWMVEPIIGRHQDNIWLPHGVDRLRAGAQPAAKWDVFLAH